MTNLLAFLDCGFALIIFTSNDVDLKSKGKFSSLAKRQASGTQIVFNCSANFMHMVVLPLDSGPIKTIFLSIYKLKRNILIN